ncbi:DUF3124 domain-containing protein [bacterium]|nr:DUF3124 domain-containing protein [bacterium]
MSKAIQSFLAVLIFAALTATTVAEDCSTPGLSRGQSIYVPAYSHIYSGNNERPFLMTVTLSIRNIDPEHSITVTAVDYYETQGKFLTAYLDSAVVLGPLESLRYVVPEKDTSGGSGANFMVDWESDRCVNPPIVESIMIGTQMQQGLSFTSRGRVVIPSE